MSPNDEENTEEDATEDDEDTTEGFVKPWNRQKLRQKYDSMAAAAKEKKGEPPSQGWSFPKERFERTGVATLGEDWSSEDSDEDSVYLEAAEAGMGPNGCALWREEDISAILRETPKGAVGKLRELCKYWLPKDTSKRTMVITTVGSGEFQFLAIDKEKLSALDKDYEEQIADGLKWEGDKPKRIGNMIQFGAPAIYPIYLPLEDEKKIPRDQVAIHELQAAFAAELLHRRYPDMGWRNLYVKRPSLNSDAPLCNVTELGDRMPDVREDWFLQPNVDELNPAYNSAEGARLYQAPRFASNQVGLATTLHLNVIPNSADWNETALREFIEMHHLELVCNVELMASSSTWFGIALKNAPLEMHNTIAYERDKANSFLSNPVTALRLAMAGFPAIRGEPDPRRSTRDYNNVEHWATTNGAPSKGKKGLSENVYQQLHNLEESMVGKVQEERHLRLKRTFLHEGIDPPAALLVAMGHAMGHEANPATVTAMFGFGTREIAQLADKISTGVNGNSTDHARTEESKKKLQSLAKELMATKWKAVLDNNGTIVDIEPEKRKEKEALVRAQCFALLAKTDIKNFHDMAIAQRSLEALGDVFLGLKYANEVVKKALSAIIKRPKMLRQLEPTSMLLLMQSFGADLVFDSPQHTANLPDVKAVMANAVFGKTKRIAYETRLEIMRILNPDEIHTGPEGGHITDLIVKKILVSKISDDITKQEGGRKSRSSAHEDLRTEGKQRSTEELRLGTYDRPPTDATDGYRKKPKPGDRRTLSDDDGHDTDRGEAAKKTVATRVRGSFERPLGEQRTERCR